jgi:hypothetical protein
MENGKAGAGRIRPLSPYLNPFLFLLIWFAHWHSNRTSELIFISCVGSVFHFYLSLATIFNTTTFLAGI